MESMELLAELPLASIIQSCRDDGLQMPYHAAALGVNGIAIVLRFTDEDDGLHYKVVLHGGDTDEPLQSPVNLMVVAADGTARLFYGVNQH
jgi:hypothetical protein